MRSARAQERAPRLVGGGGGSVSSIGAEGAPPVVLVVVGSEGGGVRGGGGPSGHIQAPHAAPSRGSPVKASARWAAVKGRLRP